MCEGQTLHVNIDSAYGELRVSVLDRAGEPIEGFLAEQSLPIREDSVDVTVGWQDHDSIAELRGRPVRLKFELQEARCYSFWVD